MFHSVKKLRIAQLYATYILVFSCLACTLGQVLVLPLKLVARRLFYFLNEKLAYAYFCLIPFLVENWGGFKVQVYGEKGLFDVFNSTKDTNLLIVMNHTGEVDWMVGWTVLDKVGQLGLVKTVMKNVVKYVPVFGWSFYLLDYIFVKRSAQKDIPRIEKACDLYRNYRYKFVMSIFPEGTRFTKEKHDQSLAYAADKGLPQYKYHLLPRTKGLFHLLRMMKQNSNSKYLYDLEFAYREREATTLGFLNADQGHCDVYMHYFPLADIPSDEEQFTEWVYQLFEEKDKLMGYHKTNKKFPGELFYSDQGFWRSKLALLWAVVSSLPILCFASYLLLTGHWQLLLLLTGGVTLLGSLAFNLLIKLTESKHGSSYGLQSNSSKKKQD